MFVPEECEEFEFTIITSEAVSAFPPAVLSGCHLFVSPQAVFMHTSGSEHAAAQDPSAGIIQTDS